MPSIRLWSWNTNIAADDLPVPVAACAFFHAGLIALSISALVGFKHHPDVHHYIKSYSYIMLLICTTSLALECSIYFYARQGWPPLSAADRVHTHGKQPLDNFPHPVCGAKPTEYVFFSNIEILCRVTWTLSREWAVCRLVGLL
jgi:ABC-type dipeptide/oligopeptide/nickel transport system permease component